MANNSLITTESRETGTKKVKKKILCLQMIQTFLLVKKTISYIILTR